MLEGCTPWPPEFVQRYREKGYWTDQTLGDLLDEVVARYGPKEAVVGDEGTRLTYQELGRLTNRLALNLLELGLQPRDRVLVQLPNVPQFVVLYFALQKIGAIPVMCLPQHRFHEMSFFGELTEATAYVIPGHYRGFDYPELARQVREKVPSLKHILVLSEDTPKETVSLKQLLRLAVEERVGVEKLRQTRPDPMEVALFLLSGGTTGLPKLIPRTHNDYIYNSRAITQVCLFQEDTVYLCILPVEHNYPLVCGLQPTLMRGGKFIISQSPDAEHILNMIQKERVTILPTVPSILIRLLDHPRLKEYDLSSLKVINSGAQKLQPDLKPRVEETFGCPVQEAFGMAEGLICFTRLDDPPEVRYQTVGRPICPDDEVRLVDERGNDVPPGEIGELICRGPYTLRGYYKAEEHNRRAFNQEGFYLTGDLMRRGPGGGLIVEGRRKDMINRGGEHISAEEIENLILTHPAVHNAAVIGMPDPVLGERICAYVILKPGQTLTLPELVTFLQQKEIAKFKLPERLEVVDSFPLTNIGKVSKKDLREDIARKLQAG
jgi:2,3-dihydroxybenzoate-AMP ligase